jgi:hypothetical protein
MQSSELEQQIIRFLELTRFADDLVVVVHLPLEPSASRMSAAQSVGVLVMA